MEKLALFLLALVALFTIEVDSRNKSSNFKDPGHARRGRGTGDVKKRNREGSSSGAPREPLPPQTILRQRKNPPPSTDFFNPTNLPGPNDTSNDFNQQTTLPGPSGTSNDFNQQPTFPKRFGVPEDPGHSNTAPTDEFNSSTNIPSFGIYEGSDSHTNLAEQSGVESYEDFFNSIISEPNPPPTAGSYDTLSNSSTNIPGFGIHEGSDSHTNLAEPSGIDPYEGYFNNTIISEPNPPPTAGGFDTPTISVYTPENLYADIRDRVPPNLEIVKTEGPIIFPFRDQKKRKAAASPRPEKKPRDHFKIKNVGGKLVEVPNFSNRSLRSRKASRETELAEEGKKLLAELHTQFYMPEVQNTTNTTET